MTTLTNLFSSPQPNETIVCPSGQVYGSDQYNLIRNVNQTDIPFLTSVGCVQLAPRAYTSTTRAPTNTDDYTQLFGVGSQWTYINGAVYSLYGCTAMGSTPGSATWVLLTAYSPPAPTIQNIATATYTVASTDSGKVLNLNGGIFQTITFPAATTLGAGFNCTLANGETTVIGKGVSGLGSWSFTLYPGQTYRVLNVNGALIVLDGPYPPSGSDNPCPVQWKSDQIALFVDKTLGSDDPMVADGLAAGARAYKTLKHAWSILYLNFNGMGSFAYLNVANAAQPYQESVYRPGLPVGVIVTFMNGPTGGFTWQPASISTPYCFEVGDLAICEYSNTSWDASNLTSGSATAIEVHQDAIIDQNSGVSFGSFGSTAGYHIATDGGGGTYNINGSYAVNGVGGMNHHMHLPSLIQINQQGGISVTITNAPQLGAAWYYVVGGGVINVGASCTWTGALGGTGAKPWVVGPAGTLFCNGNSANIPNTGGAGSPTISAAPTGASGWAVV